MRNRGTKGIVKLILLTSYLLVLTGFSLPRPSLPLSLPLALTVSAFQAPAQRRRFQGNTHFRSRTNLIVRDLVNPKSSDEEEGSIVEFKDDTNDDVEQCYNTYSIELNKPMGILLHEINQLDPKAGDYGKCRITGD